MKSLSQLSTLVLFGIGAATSIAHSLFMSRYDQTAEPLLPRLSSFLLAIADSEMSPNHDDLSNFLEARQHHHLPRLQNLSINSQYIQYLRESNRMDILWESSENIFVISDPEIGKFNSIQEEKLLRHE